MTYWPGMNKLLTWDQWPIRLGLLTWGSMTFRPRDKWTIDPGVSGLLTGGQRPIDLGVNGLLASGQRAIDLRVNGLLTWGQWPIDLRSKSYWPGSNNFENYWKYFWSFWSPYEFLERHLKAHDLWAPENIYQGILRVFNSEFLKIIL